MKRSASGPILGLLGLSFVASLPANATSYVPVSDENLVAKAALVVRARVVAAEPSAAPAGIPSTDYTAEVREVLKGAAPTAPLIVRVPGGIDRSRGLGMYVYGAPEFGDGEEVLLFLTARRDGTFAPLHLMLGAFHEVRANGRTLALRNLSEARAVTPDGRGAAPEAVRDAARFAEWIAHRAAGRPEPANYLVSAAGSEGALQSVVDEFTLLTYRGTPTRFFEFDTGGSVPFFMHQSGQGGVPGGGFNEFQQAMGAWNAESQTPIKLTFAGTTGSNEAFQDEISALTPGDPQDNIAEDFDCGMGGVLAIGGPLFFVDDNDDPTDVRTFNGKNYIVSVLADIVMNDNTDCFYASSANPSKAFAEVATHELGHCLGLGHSCGDANSGPCNTAEKSDATMRASVHNDGRGAGLRADDVKGIRFVYKKAGGPNPGTKPPAASGASAQALSFAAALLTFTDNAGNEVDFVVEASLNGGAFTQVAVVPGNGAAKPKVEVLLNDLTAGGVYVFRVKARNTNGSSAYATAGALDLPSSTSCTVSGTNMCLFDRFAGRLEFRSSASAPFSFGQVSILETEQSGLFFFANPSNLEMLVKMVNACGSGAPRYWVFVSAATNVEFVLTVIDTQSGFTRRYKNPLNTPAAPVQDTDAFATCP